jgi:hypothetical protein
MELNQASTSIMRGLFSAPDAATPCNNLLWRDAPRSLRFRTSVLGSIIGAGSCRLGSSVSKLQLRSHYALRPSPIAWCKASIIDAAMDPSNVVRRSTGRECSGSICRDVEEVAGGRRRCI